MEDRALAARRLHSLGLSRPRFPSPAAVVEGLLAVQAENLGQASWAVATRVDGQITASDVARALDDGQILRTHVLRPTWHFVRPDDVRWLLELTAPRVRRVLVAQQQELGVTDRQLHDAADVIEQSLSGGVHLTRAELGDRLADAGLPSSGRQLGALLFHAEQTGIVCSGRANGGEQTYALLDERAPGARRLDRDEALAELALRYVAGHGPATERDLAYWATLTLTDVRAGLASVRDDLASLEVADRTYWYAESSPPDARPEPRAHLLQVLDEYHNGYQHSRDLLDLDGLVPRGRQTTTGMVLVDGQMIGGMRRHVHDDHATFEVLAFRDLADDEVEALRDAAQRYGTFLQRDVRLELTRP